MKFLVNYYKQISYLLISFLVLDTIAVATLFLFQVNKGLDNYASLGLVFLVLIAVLFGVGQIVAQLLNRKLLVWSFLVYGIYTLFSYLLTVTQHVNDFDFKAENIFSNHFVEVNGLPYLLLIFLFAYLINRFSSLQKYHSQSFLTVDEFNIGFLEILFLSQSFLLLSLTDSKMTAIFQQQSLLMNYLSDSGLQFLRIRFLS